MTSAGTETRVMTDRAVDLHFRFPPNPTADHFRFSDIVLVLGRLDDLIYYAHLYAEARRRRSSSSQDFENAISFYANRAKQGMRVRRLHAASPLEVVLVVDTDRLSSSLLAAQRIVRLYEQAQEAKTNVGGATFIEILDLMLADLRAIPEIGKSEARDIANKAMAALAAADDVRITEGLG